MKPKIGQIWRYKDTKSLVGITDIAKKKKNDHRYNDDYFNEAKDGQTFIYGYNYKDNCTITGKVKIEDFLEELEYVETLDRCTCPNCKNFHFKERFVEIYKKQGLWE